MTLDAHDQPAAAPQRAAHHCLDCRHYFITWDPSFPYGCRLMGFKSRQLPGQEVREATGHNCLAFQARPVAAHSSSQSTDGTS